MQNSAVFGHRAPQINPRFCIIPSLNVLTVYFIIAIIHFYVKLYPNILSEGGMMSKIRSNIRLFSLQFRSSYLHFTEHGQGPDTLYRRPIQIWSQ